MRHQPDDVMNADILVYEAPGGRYYMMYLAEPTDRSEAGWWEWPAEEDGWARRRRITEPSTERLFDWHELPSFNAWLALKLSGVTP